MEYFRSDLRAKFNDPQQLMNIAYAVNVSVPQLEQMELEFIQNERGLPPPTPSPFVDENFRKWSAVSKALSPSSLRPSSFAYSPFRLIFLTFLSSLPATILFFLFCLTNTKEKIHINQILVENHELKERNRQQAEEMQELQLASEQYKKKMEADKIILLRRLTTVNESLETALTEKREMREKMGRFEKDLDNMQANIKDLMTANVTLSEELRLVRPRALTPTPRPVTPTSLSSSTTSTTTSSPSSPSAPMSPTMNSPSFSFRKRGAFI